MNTARKLIEFHRKYNEPIKQVCERLAPEIGVSAKYLYQIAYKRKKYKPSQKVTDRITELLGGKEKREYPPTVTIRYEPGDPRRKRALSLTMEQRQDALDYWYHKEMMK